MYLSGNRQSKNESKRRPSDVGFECHSKYQTKKRKENLSDKPLSDENRGKSLRGSVRNRLSPATTNCDPEKRKSRTAKGTKKVSVTAVSTGSRKVKKKPSNKSIKIKNTTKEAYKKNGKTKTKTHGTQKSLPNTGSSTSQPSSNVKSNLKAEDQNVKMLRKAKTFSVTTVRKGKEKRLNTVKNDASMEWTKSLDTNFSELLLKKIEIKHHIPPPVSDESLPYLKPVGGISVTNDNLIWVNYILHRQIKLFASCGKVLRTFDLDHSPYYNCCIPSGDLLYTQGTVRISNPDVTLVSRKGDVTIFAELTSYASKLCGIVYQDDQVYVIGQTVVPQEEYIIQLNMKGEVQNIFNSKPDLVHFNQLVSICGQIIGIFTEGFALFPLQRKCVSSKSINKVFVNYTYSTSASVDNFGNLVIGKMSKIVVVEPSLERLHEVDTELPERALITATAVDHQNRLWIGTGTGDLYITRHLH